MWFYAFIPCIIGVAVGLITGIFASLYFSLFLLGVLVLYYFASVCYWNNLETIARRYPVMGASWTDGRVLGAVFTRHPRFNFFHHFFFDSFLEGVTIIPTIAMLFLGIVLHIFFIH